MAKTDHITVSIQLERGLAEQLRQIAKAEYRSLSAELRRLAEHRVAEYDAPPTVAAVADLRAA